MEAGSNSQTALDGLVERCNQSLQHGMEGGLASLEAHRDAGAALLELKELLPWGQFGPVAEARCGCSKQWRARLMQLNREWENVQAAMRWAESCGRNLGRRAYSVDGAVALVNEWRRAEAGDARPSKSARSAKPRMEAILRESAILKERLSAAAAYIAGLEDELAELRSLASERQEVDAPTRDEIKKVAALWLGGGKDAERRSAVHQLWGIARRRGWNLRDLLHECAIEGPADWTFAESR